jgi:hypothetical protein
MVFFVAPRYVQDTAVSVVCQYRALHFFDTRRIIGIMGIYITGDKPANPDHFVSVDPGVKHCGVAIWDPVSKQLRRAFLCDSTKGVHFLQKLPTLDGVVSGVIEIPQRYPGSPRARRRPRSVDRVSDGDCWTIGRSLDTGETGHMDAAMVSG